MSKPLKPCPFCGSPARLLGTEFEGHIGCSNDDCAVSPSVFKKRVGRGESLVPAWNDRAEVQPWNRDISQAPKGEVRKVQRGEREAEVHHPVRIIAAGSGGVVTLSQWDPKREAWSMFTKDAPPVAWMTWPEHPGAGDYEEAEHG